MRVRSIFVAVVVLCSSVTAAQHITFEQSYDYGYGETAYAVIQTSDDGYLLAGKQGIAPFYAKGLLIKTDAHGVEQWHNMVWAGCDTYVYDVKALEDGGYILVGDHCRPAMASNMFLARTDEFGDTLWLRSFGTWGDDYARGVEVLADGGFMLSGTWGIAPSKGALIRTDEDGNVLWQRFYLPHEATESVFESLSMAEDDSFYMCGTAHFQDSERQNMLYVVKADTDGNVIWERYFGGTGNDVGMAVASVPGGGAFAAGFTWSFGAGHYDMYLIRLTEDGDTLWTNTFGTGNEETVEQVIALADGGAVLAGTAYSGGSPDGKYQFVIVRTGADGEPVWSEQFGRADTYSMYAYGAIQSIDAGYAIVGVSHYDAHLIKTNPQGQVVGFGDYKTEAETATLYPNPAKDVCKIRFPRSWSAADTISVEVFNMVETKVVTTNASASSGDMSLEVGHLSPGLYYARLRTAREQCTIKFIVH